MARKPRDYKAEYQRRKRAHPNLSPSEAAGHPKVTTKVGKDFVTITKSPITARRKIEEAGRKHVDLVVTVKVRTGGDEEYRSLLVPGNYNTAGGDSAGLVTVEPPVEYRVTVGPSGLYNRGDYSHMLSGKVDDFIADVRAEIDGA